MIESNSPDNRGQIFRGKLNLCDLAGSEKIHKEEIMDQKHMLELKTINLSLSCLGKVIQSLAQGQNRNHVSYRDSKITRLLQDSLGGNTRTTLIAAVSPLIDHSEETISTLKFADRAKKIMTKTSANQISAADDALVLKLQKEIQHLKDILNLKRRGGNQDLHQQLLVLKEENSKLREMVTKQGDADKLREENYRMRHELMVLRHTDEQMLMIEDRDRDKSPALTETKIQAYNRTADDGFEHAPEGGQGGFFMTQSEQFQEQASATSPLLADQ